MPASIRNAERKAVIFKSNLFKIPKIKNSEVRSWELEVRRMPETRIYHAGSLPGFLFFCSLPPNS
jgi:hypothetical protein